MFDFAGYIPKAGKARRLSMEAAWEGYRHLLRLEVEKQHYDSGDLQLCALQHPGRAADQVEEEGVFVAVCGSCYIRSQNGGGDRLNARAIRRRYHTGDLSFLSELKGRFILIIHDARRQELHLAVDSLSLKSLYYRECPAGWVFATSLPALVRLARQGAADPEWDPASVVEYYLFDFTLGDHTFLEGVRELQAGQVLTVKQGEGRVSAYSDPFRLFPLSEEHLSEGEAADFLTETLQRNIASMTDGPQQTALPLTGGYDSRSVAALVGADFQQYQYYSYGDARSWDVKIPQLLARKNHLDYQFIDMKGAFATDFSRYAQQAICLGDGIAEASRANYPYVYANHLRDKQSILSGLFGSELIKTPSSRGLFIDENMLAILRAAEPGRALDELYDAMQSSAVFERSFTEGCREEVYRRVLEHPLIVNDLPLNEKLFYFILLIGCRKYFAKEIKLERFFIDNKTPFFDVDFIQGLLKTPYPWVYNWTEEKSLTKNLKIHRIYAAFISRNKGLLNTVTTHGFKPAYLRSPLYYPLLAAEFLRTKKKMSRESRVSYDEQLRGFFAQAVPNASIAFPVSPEKRAALADRDFKNYVKLNSLGRWFEFIHEWKKNPAAAG